MSAKVVALPDGQVSDSRGIKSVETGGRVLAALCESAEPLDLKALAARANVTSSLAHAYLTSFGRLGLARQDPRTKRYALGELAIELGLVALSLLDPIQQALQTVASLQQELGLTVALTVWGDYGPTVIRVERAEHPLHITLYEGAVLPLYGTVTGRLFCAFLPPPAAQAALQAESARLRGVELPAGLLDEFHGALPDIRARRMARLTDRPVPGIHTFGAPVFDYTGAIVCAILVVGLAGSIDDSWDSAVARTLERHAHGLSARMGYSDRAELNPA